VPEDAPLYSKSTDLPIYSKTTGLPIQGDPDACGCCGSACALCGSDRTPTAVQIVLSGLTPCPDCLDGLQWNVKEREVPDGTQRHEKKPCGCRKRRSANETAEASASAPREGSPPPTRPSCIECIEKHLGAACVLMSECRDGYPYRLRIIGHLHEAEDESQQWPELHAAIRQARKEYQAGGVMPGWEALDSMLREPWDRLRGHTA